MGPRALELKAWGVGTIVKSLPQADTDTFEANFKQAVVNIRPSYKVPC